MALNSGGGGGMSAGAVRAGRAFVEFFADGTTLARDLTRIKAKVQAFSASVAGAGLKLFGLGAAGLLPLKYATDTFAAFDDAIRAAGAAATASEAELGRMTETAKELGRTTSFTAVEVAKLMIELGRAGFKPDQINVMTGAVLDLSRATGTDAARSATFLADAIRQFNLQAGDARRVADALTGGANMSANTVEALAEALKYAGPVAADFHADLEDVVAILGALGNTGIRGSEAGTALRRLYTQVGAESKKLFETFGVQARDGAGNARPVVDVLDDIFKATESLGTGERAEKFNDFFGLLSITSASVLSKNAKGVRELRDGIGGAGGIAARTAKEMDAGIGGAIRMLTSAVEGAVIAFGENLAPTLQVVAKGFELATGLARGWVSANPQVAAAAVGVTAGLLATGGALIALGLAGKAAAVGLFLPMTILSGIGTALALLNSPLLVVGGAMAALWVTQTDSGKRFADATGQTLTTFGDDAGAVFGRLGGDFQTAWGGIVAAIQGGDLEAAGKIAFAGLEVLWAEAMLAMTKGWEAFKQSTAGEWVTETVKGVKELHALATKEAAGAGGGGGGPGSPEEPSRVGTFGWAVDNTATGLAGWYSLGVWATQGKQAADAYMNEFRANLTASRDAADRAKAAEAEEAQRRIDEAAEKAKAAREGLQAQADAAKFGQTGNVLGELFDRVAIDAGQDAIRAADEAKRKGAGAVGAIPTKAQIFDAVKGATGGAFSRQQFAFGDKVNEKQLAANLRTAKAAEETAVGLKELPQDLADELTQFFTVR